MQIRYNHPLLILSKYEGLNVTVMPYDKLGTINDRKLAKNSEILDARIMLNVPNDMVNPTFIEGEAVEGVFRVTLSDANEIAKVDIPGHSFKGQKNIVHKIGQKLDQKVPKIRKASKVSTKSKLEGMQDIRTFMHPKRNRSEETSENNVRNLVENWENWARIEDTKSPKVINPSRKSIFKKQDDEKIRHELRSVRKTPMKNDRRRFSKLDRESPKLPLIRAAISNWERKVQQQNSNSDQNRAGQEVVRGENDGL